MAEVSEKQQLAFNQHVASLALSCIIFSRRTFVVPLRARQFQQTQWYSVRRQRTCKFDTKEEPRKSSRIPSLPLRKLSSADRPQSRTSWIIRRISHHFDLNEAVESCRSSEVRVPATFEPLANRQRLFVFMGLRAKYGCRFTSWWGQTVPAKAGFLTLLLTAPIFRALAL